MTQQNTRFGFLPVLIVVGVAVVGFSVWIRTAIQPPGSGNLQRGQPLPEIKALGWLNGEGPTAESLKGKVVVVEAWATWCKPCIDAIPHVKSVHKKYSKKGVVFISLTNEGRDDISKINKIIEHTEMAWPVGYGATETLVALEAVTIPSMWIVGPNGVIVWNGDPRDEFEAEIDKALALAPAK